MRWINDDPDRVDASAWRLRVVGAVARPLDLTYEEVGKRLASKTATLDCTGGWYTTQVWRGLPLADLLDETGPSLEAGSVTVRSLTGYYRRFSLGEARSYLLAALRGWRAPVPRAWLSPCASWLRESGATIG